MDKDWFIQLIEDCKAIFVETEFTARWALVEGYHQLGTRILQENENFERQKIYGQEIVQRVAESLGKSPRTIWYCLQFAQKYPSLDEVPEGKAISWNRIKTHYLTEKIMHDHAESERIDMTTSQIVEDILKRSQKARNSDKELLIEFMDYFGMELTFKQKQILRDMPILESARRTRQKFQEKGMYQADPLIAKERRFKSYTIQQRIPQTRPEKIPQVMQNEFHYPKEWI